MAQQYAVDVLVQTRGQRGLTALNSQLQRSADNTKKLNSALGGLKGAVGQLAGLAGVALGVGAAFDQIKKADAAAASLRSIGANTKELIPALAEVRKELNNNASQAELTRSAFEVLQAGFKDTADVTAIIDASTTAAKAKLADTAVVTKALTSVLNAYNIEASKSSEITNKFFKTIKDGNLTIEEYSGVIGSLAPLGQAAGVGLEEINAALARITQTGSSAGEAATGIQAALRALIAPTDQAKKLAKELGIELTQSALASKGFSGILQDVAEKTGGNTEQLFTLFGSVEGLRAVLALAGDDFEGFNKALKSQRDDLDAVGKAFDANANTISGSLTRIANAFTGLISSGSGLGRVLIPVFDGIAQAISALETPAGAAAGAIGGVALAVYGLQKAIIAVKSTALAAWLTGQIALFGKLGAGVYLAKLKMDALAASTKLLTGLLGGLKIALLALPFIGIAMAIEDARKRKMAFDEAMKSDSVSELDAAIASATAEMDKLNAAHNQLQRSPAYKGKVSDVQDLKRRLDEAKMKVEELTKRRKLIIEVEMLFSGGNLGDIKSSGYGRNNNGLTYTVAGVTYDARTGKPVVAAPKVPEVPKVPGGGSGGGGGGGGGGAAPSDDIAGLRGQLDLLNQIAPLQERINEARLAGDQMLVTRLEGEKQMIQLIAQGEEAVRNMNTEEGKSLQARINQLEQSQLLVETEQQLAELRQQQAESIQGVLQPLEDEIELLQAKLNGNEDEIKQLQEIKRLKEQIAEIDPNADTSGVAARVQQRDQLREQVAAQEELERAYESLASGIASDMTNAFKSIIDGSKDADEAFAEMLQNMANRFLDMAMKIIQDAITQQLMGLFSGLFGGFGGGGSGSLFGGNSSIGSGFTHGGNKMIAGFADGGRPPIGQVSLVGERGPELFVPDQPGRIYSNEQSRAMLDQYSASNERTAMPQQPIQVEYTSTSIAGTEYVTAEQFERGMATAAERGAKGGETRVMSSLRNRRSSRSRIGLR